MSSMKQQGKRKQPEGVEKPPAKRSKAPTGKHVPKHGSKGPPAKAPPKLLSKKEQKEAVKSKKLKFKKNYATIQETVLLWEQLRPKQTSKEERAKLVSTILKKLQGNSVELANHHSASRVIQWCMKEGSAADKAKLVAEVRSNIVPLSKSKYGRHVVQKLISMSGKEEVPGIAKLFKGHVAELLRHPSGADVLDDLYSVCPQSCRNTLCAELYGREFTLFDGVATHSEAISNLGQLLQGVNAAKRQAVIQHLYKGLAPVLEKALLHPVMTHRLLRELLTEAPGSLVADAVDTLAATGGNALKLVHTHDGAAAAAMALAYGTPKDRKRLVKGMKGYVWQTAENEWGHAVVATALSVVDDTALTGKTILTELKAKLEELCTNKHAHRVLMQLLAPDSHRYLPPATFELLHPPAKTMMAAANAPAAGAAAAGLEGEDEEIEDPGLDGEEQQQEMQWEGDDEEEEGEEEEGEEQDQEEEGAAAAAGDSEGEEEGAAGSAGEQLVERQLGESKKAADVRRRELLGSGKGSLSTALLALCAEQGPSLLRHPVGCDVLVEVARGAAGGLLWQLDQAGVEAVHAAVVQQVAQDCSRVGSSIKAAGEDQQQQQRGKKKGKKGASQQAAADAAAGNSAGDEQQQEEDEEPLLTHYFSSRALRRLLLAGSSEGADGAGARAFAEQLWQQALQGQCKQLIGSHAEKVLAGLLHCGVEHVVQQAAAELQPLVGGDAQAWAAKFMGPPAGGAAADGQQKKKQKGHKQQPKQPEKQQQQQQRQQEQAAKQQQQQAGAVPSPKNSFSASKRKKRVAA